MAVGRSDIRQSAVRSSALANPPLLTGDERKAAAQPSSFDHSAEDIPTYYDLPSLKQSFYGWKVSTYILIAGIAGSSQILAAIAEFTDAPANQSVIRNARYVALGGSI